MLRSKYSDAKTERDEQWQTLERFFTRLNVQKSAFLSMNWDSVIEEGTAEAQGPIKFDYGCDAQPAEFLLKTIIELRLDPDLRSVTLIKPHGSVNWLYCDTCRRLYWFPAHRTERIAAELFTARDWDIIEGITNERFGRRVSSHACPVCGSYALATRLATFSYRKALDFPMHQASWLSAERLLRDARNWIFIGYSLPAADYEFKYLLKNVERARASDRPYIVVISGGDAEATKAAHDHYYRFFGRRISKKEGTYFDEGLSAAAFTALRKLGALRPVVPPRRLTPAT